MSAGVISKTILVGARITLGLTNCPKKSTGNKPGERLDDGLWMQFCNFLFFIIYKQHKR